jgi:Flp pilus assembly protein TadB
MSELNSTDLNDMTRGQQNFILASVMTLRIFLALILGTADGLIWWLIATNYHGLWVFLVFGVAFALVHLVLVILNNYLKLKKGKS